MPPLPAMGWRDIVKAFQKLGWVLDRQSGSHISLVKEGEAFILTVPKHKEVRKGTLRSLIRRAGLTIDEFLAAVQS